MSATKGHKLIEWAGRHMPVVKAVQARLVKEESFKNIRLAACLHITAETANLALALKAGGADVRLCASNPLSTQDDVAQSLRHDYKIPVFAKHSASPKEYYRHIRECLLFKPQLTVDDGADLVTYIHTKAKRLLKNVWGGTEETTTGVIRLAAQAKAKKLHYPIIAVNNALTKHLFDNYYGTGQSTIDGLLRATNILLAGKILVVAGYGRCGRGIAARAKGMGARVIITEVNPVRALEASMDGYEILPMLKAARVGDIFITATGCREVIIKDHFKLMKDGVILANAGHFDVEIDLQAVDKLNTKIVQLRDNLTEYTLKNGRRLYVLAQGRLVNLVSAEGHPASVMDMSFANQALSLEYLVKHHADLKPGVYTVPADIDTAVAELKLKSLGLSCDTLTPRQKKYLSSWQVGT